MAVAICGAGIVDLRSTNTVMAIAKKYAAATYAAYGGRVRVIKAAESALVIRLAGTSRLAVATAESRESAAYQVSTYPKSKIEGISVPSH